MELHVFRHGPAADREEAGVSTDRERPLTDDGADRTAERARGVGRVIDTPDAIVTSPYRRARQSARILADALRFDHDAIDDLDALEPERDPMKTLEVLWNRYDGDVAIVGHKPHLRRVVAGALTGQADGFDVRLGTASLATIEIVEDGAELVRLVPPSELESLAVRR